MSQPPFHSGFAAIVGRPNVGKSTLLNAILGEKIVITSDKPQTTRNRIQGIHNVPSGQIVFVDTPGVHKAKSRLNRSLVDTAMEAVSGVDVILFLVEANTSPSSEKEMIDELLASVTAPVFLVINKVDLVEKERLLKSIETYSEFFPFKEIIPVSAQKGDGVERLVELVCGYLPTGPAYFPDDILTDLPERFVVAEMVREKIFRLTHDEVPYSVAVQVESFKERPNGLIAISAAIIVERDSQKGIIIGKKGEMLKRIGTAARQEIERFLAEKVFLELFVKVSKDWSDNPQKLKEFGY
ncbi:MAG: GTPase Era [Geobacteraceae bacterium]|nr:GTPase Era [Geobacteraceae bacterium]